MKKSTMSLRIDAFPAPLQRQVKAQAAIEGRTLKDWIILALREKLAKGEEK